MSLLWERSEVPDNCVYKALTHVIGDPELRGTSSLPIDKFEAEIVEAIRNNKVVAVQAPTGSGKTMRIPRFMFDNFNPREASTSWPILVVQQSNFAAENVVESLVGFFGWTREQIQLRTGQFDSDRFVKGRTAITVATYGIVWRWLTSGPDDLNAVDLAHDFVLLRYAGIFLDEFADLPPTSEEACRMIGRLLRLEKLWLGSRVLVAGYAIQASYVRQIFGEHHFVVVTGRKHTMERCVVTPATDREMILKIAAELALAAIGRGGDRQGDVLVFLPGLHEMLIVQGILKSKDASLKVSLLHSDAIGNEDETIQDVPERLDSRVVSLSTIIGARTITFATIRYVIVHPAVRAEVLHASGTTGLIDEALSNELEGNMSGRVARVSSGLATFLYYPDDSALDLSLLPRVIRPQAMKTNKAILTLVVGSPSRFYCVQHTVRHLRSRGFEKVYWLRTPASTELDEWNDDPKKRVMMFWYTTVLPALLILEKDHGASCAFVVEDTCLLAPGVTYDDVVRETSDTTGSLFGYGGYVARNKKIQWHGTKGLFVTARWCHELNIILGNLRIEEFEHFDLWLKKRLQHHLPPGLYLCKPIAGYGHRMSLTSRQGPVFGGAWLPSQTEGQNTDRDAFVGSPLAMRLWVIACRDLVPNIKRGDPAPCPLKCPELINSSSPIGVWEFSAEWLNETIASDTMTADQEAQHASNNVSLMINVPMKTDIFEKCVLTYDKKEKSIKYIDETWQILQWQKSPQALALFGTFPDLRPDVMYLANLRFAGCRKTSWPLSPRMAGFVEAALLQNVGYEAINLACLIETGAATFNPLPLYSAAGHSEQCPLLVFSQILDDVGKFFIIAKEVASLKRTSWQDMKVNPGKLRKAEQLWYKCVAKIRMKRSTLEPALQSRRLTELLSDAFPEQVAYLFDGVWYAAGLRVRGDNLPKACVSERILLFCPKEEKWVKKSSDHGQRHLKCLLCLALPVRAMKTLVIIGDSTCDEIGFRYGLTRVFLQAGIFVAWFVCQGGAKAADLIQAWSKAPRADFGLTIYNCNDVMTNWLWDEGIANAVAEIVVAARTKCKENCFYYVNSASLYPGLRRDCYPALVWNVTAVLQSLGEIVFDGAAFEGKIKLRDSMHFDIASTEQVVQMFSGDVIRNIMALPASSSSANVVSSVLPHTSAARALELSLKIAEEAARMEDLKCVAATRKRSVDDMLRADEEERVRAGQEDVLRLEERDRERQSKRQAKEWLVWNFLADVQNAKPGWSPIIQKPPFDSRRPLSLPDCDDRFHRVKKERVYVCDSCGHIVTFSTWNKNKVSRELGEYQGSYSDTSWRDSIPGEFLLRAYEEGLIDCTWHCTQFCLAVPTGVKDRTTRTRLWRENKYSGSRSSSGW